MEDSRLIKGNWESFLTLTNEKLLYVGRRHIFVLVLPLLFLSFVMAVLIAANYYLYSYVIKSISLFTISTLLLATIGASFAAQIIVRWYFNLHVLTNKKIMIVNYTPLFSHVVTDVLLDKINCTEIDLVSKGFFHELIGVGDVAITFDRPTHQDEFVFSDVGDCHNLARFLTQKLMDRDLDDKAEEVIWVRSRVASSLPAV